MSKGSRIFYTMIAVIAVVIIACFAVFAFWSRPGRLDDMEMSELVLKAWQSVQSGEQDGIRIMTYDVGGRRYRSSVNYPLRTELQAFAGRIRQAFPGVEPDEEFLGRFDISHEGRVWVNGLWCEKIRISPVNYSGNSTEIWIEPSSGNPYGWRRLDFNGALINGWRYRGRYDFNAGDRETPVEVAPEAGLGGFMDPGMELVNPDFINQRVMLGEIALPHVLPEGFKLVGGRRISNPLEIERFTGFLPGMGPGRMNRIPGEPGPAPDFAGFFQIIFSDGLNTVSMIQIPIPLTLEMNASAERLDEVLRFKSGEINRVFHTSMSGRPGPGFLLLFFGEVSQEELDGIARSVNFDALILPETGRPFDQRREGPLGPGMGGGPMERQGGQFGRQGPGGHPEGRGPNNPGGSPQAPGDPE